MSPITMCVATWEVLKHDTQRGPKENTVPFGHLKKNIPPRGLFRHRVCFVIWSVFCVLVLYELGGSVICERVKSIGLVRRGARQ